MTCDRYRPLLALLVGNDLDPREAAEVRQHVSGCAGCQAQWKSLENSMKALQVVSQQTVTPDSGNLWPELSKRVGVRPAAAREPAPGWMTLGAFTAACAAVLWLTVSAPVFDFDFGEAQLAELNADQVMAPGSIASGPIAGQFPQLQFVNDTQPAIPFRFAPDGAIESPSPLEVPARMLGGPRSF
ncbi:MAG: hypothetical protein JWN70_102 [Planctomycetaceae bacterium]|nr:hypothetical protein [Planctomycetaceae bacterium]